MAKKNKPEVTAPVTDENGAVLVVAAPKAPAVPKLLITLTPEMEANLDKLIGTLRFKVSKTALGRLAVEEFITRELANATNS